MLTRKPKWGMWRQATDTDASSAAMANSLLNPELRVPGDFPDVTIGVREVADVAAPMQLFGRTGDRGASLLRLIKQGIYLVAGSHVVRNREPCESFSYGFKTGIARQ